MRLIILSLIVIALTLSSCLPQTTVVTVVATPHPQVQPQPIQAKGVSSSQANLYVGQVTTIQIKRAYCQYRSDIDGGPTFCNDAPYPTHSFTLLVWEQNWSSYDGQCLLITGFITSYQGKPQIVAESRSQVVTCD